MGEVVDLKSRKPHKSGVARCLHCDHEFQYVVAVEDEAVAFDCPECGLEKAVFVGINLPPPDSLRYSCNKCDGIFFVILPGYVAMCIDCGATGPIEDA